MRNPKTSPRPKDRLAKIVRLRGGKRSFDIVTSRTVLNLAHRFPRGTTVIYARKIKKHGITIPFRCSLTEWKRWASSATVMERAGQPVKR